MYIGVQVDDGKSDDGEMLHCFDHAVRLTATVLIKAYYKIRAALPIFFFKIPLIFND
jgi:hypothetical protein